MAGLLSLGLLGAPAVALYSATAPATAASGDGSLTVQVIRDMGANGVYDSVIDLPLSGVSVKVSDSTGHSVTLTTDASGQAVLPANDTRLSGGKYRVDVANPDSAYFKPAFAKAADPATTPSATELSSNQEFVDLSGGNDATMTTGFWHPRDYCQSNPQVANACQPGMFVHDGLGSDAVTTPRDTVFLTNYNTSGYDDIAKSNAGSPDVAAGSEGTGAVYGIAYDRIRKQVFSAAYAKRNVDYGPLGPGGIYVTDPVTKATRAFATVPNAGTTLHNTDGIANGGDEDLAFRTAVGKESLGAIVMSDDYKKLFVVNENDKKVYVYDVTDTSGNAQPLDSFAIPDPGCTTASDWRPMGLGEADGTLYVGGVCSGENEGTTATPNPSSMRAVVMTFDETTYASNGVVLDDPLNFTRNGDIYGCMGNAGWFAWNDNLWCGASTQINVPSPMLGKIVVEPNGDLDLAFRDRNGDMYGTNLGAHTVAAPGTLINPYYQAGGDLNLACKDNTGTYVMDSNGGCGIAAVALGDPVNRFYTTKAPGLHPNASFAGMTRSRAEIGLVTDEMDGAGLINAQAINVKNRGTGADAAFQQIGQASGLGLNFGKGQGLADMDVLCDLAPIQIGNRVWYNTGSDGQQNAGEAPVVGATVNLYDKNGNLVATTKTNDKGEYYFDSLTTPGLTTDADYVVKMDNPADYAAGGALEGWKLSQTTTGPDGNPAAVGPDGYPAISLHTGQPGEDDHGLDFGFQPVPKIHIVKYDGRLPSPANPGGTLGHDDNVKNPTVYQAQANGYTGDQPVAMVVTNTGTADLVDVVVSDKTLSQPKMTGLSCDFSALGGPASGTTWQGVFKPGDSFPCTGKVNLLAGQEHGDQISVVGTQWDANTAQAVKDRSGKPVKVDDADKYYAKTGYQAKIVITKYDRTTRNEADTKATAMRFKRGEKRVIAMPATNVGTAPVHNVVIKDRTLRGPNVRALSCTFPDGKVVKANRKGEVRWAASFGKNPKLWMPGVTIHCRASLTMHAGDKLHGDRVTVTGAGPHGGKLTASNPFYATVPGRLPGVPNTGARSGR